jgi:serine protease Do
MARTREWLKFWGLVTLTVALVAAVVGTARQAPHAAAAQEQTSALEALAAPQAAPIPAAARPLADLSESFTAVAEMIRPAVVFIRAQAVEQGGQDRVQVPRGFEDFFPVPDRGPRLRRGTGTGFLISKEGHIITNNHVVDGATSLRVRLFDKREFNAEVVGRDPETDVAVIKIDARNLPALSLGNSDSVRVGEWVLAIGNPLGEAFSFTVTAGIVSAKGRLLGGLPQASQYTIMDFIQTDAVINPGNSGGPLVNIRGQVVGINSAIASENGFYQGYGFAIPVNLARNVANQLVADGRVRRSVLGIGIDNATEEDAAYAGLNEVRGVVVESFSSDDSPAKRAGIEVGDLITELDGQPVEYVAQLQQIVGFKKPGETVQVTVVRRGGQRKVIPVRLAEAPSDRLVARRAANDTAEPANAPEHRSKLGVTVEALPAQARAEVGDANVGPWITDIAIESPAYGRFNAAGRGAFGDVITHVDGQRVRTVQEFEAALRGLKPGDVVSLQLYNPQAANGAGASRTERIRVPG